MEVTIENVMRCKGNVLHNNITFEVTKYVLETHCQ